MDTKHKALIGCGLLASPLLIVLSPFILIGLALVAVSNVFAAGRILDGILSGPIAFKSGPWFYRIKRPGD